MSPRLCIGTAQFGLAYGITNKAGQVSKKDVIKMLALAAESGMEWLDTAQAYGNAEQVLGECLPSRYQFRVISKLPAQLSHEFAAEDIAIWERSFRLSAERIGEQALDALLLHAPQDLQKPGGEFLENWLFSLRDRGLVKRLGVSIYTADDLKGIHPNLLDLVQLPLSLYDQRLIQDGTLARLYQSGVAVHARSIYLQGLLLTPAQDWPQWVREEDRFHQSSLEQFAAEAGCSLLDLAVNFVKAQSELEAVVVGMCSSHELMQLLCAWDTNSQQLDQCEWQQWAIHDSHIIDPRAWPA